ncbi:hypothetical protein E2C01_027061 [Portunus trituberculatus]|uniref:Uncharacterized protein n=1 Tax=Portunus trituberculatus TaxID=210409 RepID=A0A5B7EKY5_PORTR|nr:hypothetical protein [Portunus trituberculatus]
MLELNCSRSLPFGDSSIWAFSFASSTSAGATDWVTGSRRGQEGCWVGWGEEGEEVAAPPPSPCMETCREHSPLMKSLSCRAKENTLLCPENTWLKIRSERSRILQLQEQCDQAGHAGFTGELKKTAQHTNYAVTSSWTDTILDTSERERQAPCCRECGGVGEWEACPGVLGSGEVERPPSACAPSDTPPESSPSEEEAPPRPSRLTGLAHESWGDNKSAGDSVHQNIIPMTK